VSDDEELMSSAFVVACREMAPDELRVFRIGPPANELSMIGVDIATVEESFEEDELGREVSTVVIDPGDARQLAAALLNFADECEGQTVHLVDWRTGDE